MKADRVPVTNTDRNVIMSQNIEGHRGDKDIDSLIKFIESDGEGKSKQKTNYHTNGSINFNTRHRNNVKKEDSNTVPKAKREEEEKVTRSRIQSGKKERCTDKGSQLKKSNSLEEISKSKLEDLMVNDDSVKKPLSTVSVSLEFEHHKNHALPSEDEENENVKLFVNENEDNNLWWSKQENSSGKEFVDQNSNLALVGKKRREEKKKRENLPPRNEEILSTASIPLEEPDFYVVKKKQRKKKRRSSTGGQGRDSLFDEDTNIGRCEEESDESCVNITEVESQEVVTANLPETLSPSVINFINYFRQPSTMFPQQDELVNFIGRGWLDVMAEIVHSNGKRFGGTWFILHRVAVYMIRYYYCFGWVLGLATWGTERCPVYSIGGCVHAVPNEMGSGLKKKKKTQRRQRRATTTRRKKKG
uniref:Uncharacterized protein n=1 Tax=Timema monikensis TaxID=170555 RepID=A0A7R9HLK5_9NEOP|nr:unnamed protein product [Timema monikensis]